MCCRKRSTKSKDLLSKKDLFGAHRPLFLPQTNLYPFLCVHLSSYSRKKGKKNYGISVAKALRLLEREELSCLTQEETQVDEAISLAEERGIVFIDEIDKLIDMSSNSNYRRGDAVQKELLSILDGSTVSIKQGSVKTSHILFIAAGAFHCGEPSQLLPELQGRFPVRVKMNSLSEEDFRNVLTKTKHNILFQAEKLFSAENVVLKFDDAAVSAIARISCMLNREVENIGARRLK